MISTSTLDALQDDELKSVIEQSEGLLKQRDETRKAKALDDARAIEAKALEAKRAVLASAGLSLKDLGAKRRPKGKAPFYHAGHAYQHPANKDLVWNGRGKKPGWLVELEAGGGEALEVAPANDDAVLARKAG